jgi:hypothetical protein
MTVDEYSSSGLCISQNFNQLRTTLAAVPQRDQQERLDEAFERIEETILPCITMMLETLIDASESVAENERRFLAAELKTLAAELEELTQAVEKSSPLHVQPGEYKTRNVA